MNDINHLLTGLAVFTGGLIAGYVVNELRTARLLQKIYISPKHKEADWKLARVSSNDGREFIYLNPKSYLQTLDMWLSFKVWNGSGRKQDYLLYSTKARRGVYAAAITCLAALRLI